MVLTKMFENGSELVRFIWYEVHAKNQLTTVVLGALFLMGFVLYKWNKGRKLNLPPGPFCLPIVGYLPFLSSEPFKDFDRLSKKYGNVFKVYLGRTPVVILGDFAAVKEAFSLPTTTDRPAGLFSFIPDALGFSGMNGTEWVEQRRYCVRAMRNLGLGGSKWEAMVQDEVDEFVRRIAQQCGNPIDINKLLTSSVSNNITALTLGKPLPMGHPDRELLDHSVNAVSQLFDNTGLHNFFPWIVDVLVKLGISRYAKAHKDMTRFCSFLKEEIEKWKTCDDGEENFVTGYLEEIKRNEENKLNNTFNEKNLRGNIQSFIVGGTDSTRTSLNWLFLVMAGFQDIQRKVQEEIDDVLGREGKAQWTDRSKLPFTMAVIMEGQRWITFAPLNTSRIAMEDIKICGYDIPKGTAIIANNWGLHHDTKYWTHPEKFDPNRFLSEDGTQVNLKLDSYVPFSYGKRNCPGDVVAYIEILHYFKALLQRFNVLPPEGEKPKFEGRLGLTYQAVEQKIRFVPRE